MAGKGQGCTPKPVDSRSDWFQLAGIPHYWKHGDAISYFEWCTFPQRNFTSIVTRATLVDHIVKKAHVGSLNPGDRGHTRFNIWQIDLKREGSPST